MSHDHNSHFAAPKAPEVPKLLILVGLALALVGFGVWAWKAFLGDAHDAHIAWNGYLIGFWFTMSLALAGPFLISINHLTIAGWSTSLRRIWEAFSCYIPFLFPLGLILVIFGADTLYHWLDPHAATDPVLVKKSGFLNRSWLVGSVVGSTLIWSAVILVMRRNSVKQDQVSGLAPTNLAKGLSAGFLILFVIGFSLLSWLLMMSLEPHWFSTMYQVYTFAGLFQSGLALTVLVVLVHQKKGTFGDTVGERQIHDLGQLMFGFTVFYAYIAFSQFLLIWYANIPEEDIFFVTRGAAATVSTGWEIPTLILPLLKFVVPFFLLLPQEHKKNKYGLLGIMAALLLFMQLYEVWWLVSPVPHGEDVYASEFHLPIFEGIIALGFVGLFAAVAGFAFSRFPVIPVRDPFLHEAPFHHHHGVKAPAPKQIKIS